MYGAFYYNKQLCSLESLVLCWVFESPQILKMVEIFFSVCALVERLTNGRQPVTCQVFLFVRGRYVRIVFTDLPPLNTLTVPVDSETATAMALVFSEIADAAACRAPRPFIGVILSASGKRYMPAA